HADLSNLSNHPWNDMVVDGRGNTYVDNIGFDFPGGEFAPGILALVTPDGSARQVADGVAFPNGIVVTPDNSTLVLAESYANRLTAFDTAADGTLANGPGVDGEGIDAGRWLAVKNAKAGSQRDHLATRVIAMLS